MAGNKVYVQGSYVDIHDNQVVNLSIDKAGTVQVDGHVSRPTESEPSDKMHSIEAKKYWQRLQKGGFVDASYHLMSSTTRKQAMLIAEAFAEKMDIKAKWKTFQQLWGISNLAQEKWENLEEGITVSRQEEIEQIFKD